MSKCSAMSQSATASTEWCLDCSYLLTWMLHVPSCVAVVRCSQDMQSIMSAAVMRWWPDEMVPMNRSREAEAEAKALWEGTHLYEPFDITSQVAAKYGEAQAG